MTRNRNVETLPPQNLRAEMSVIGSCLVSRQALLDCLEILDLTHFYRPAHALIWRCLHALYLRNEPIDAVTLTTELRAATWEEQSGGYDYLNQCIDVTPTPANAAHYARMVVEAFVRRQVVALAERLAAAAYDEGANIDDVISDVTTQALGLQISRDTERQLLPIREVMMEFESAVKQGPTRVQARIDTGFDSLDKVIGGYQASDLHYWGGGPGSGKTTLAMQSAWRIASASSDSLVAFFSMELGQSQFARRLASFESSIEGKTIEYGPPPRLELEMPILTQAIHRVAGLPFYVAFGRLSTAQIVTRLKQLVSRERRKPSCVFIDRIELLGDSDCASLEEVKRIPILSTRVKGIATSLDVPVVCLVQLNRAGRDGEPTMESFRASGSIEQDCQVGIIIRSDKEGKTARVTVVKHNDGETGPCPEMGWLPTYPMFVDIARRTN